MGRRLLSAFVLIPTVLAVIWFDPWDVGVFLLTLLVVGCMLLEYRSLANARGARLCIGDVLWVWLISAWWTLPVGVGPLWASAEDLLPSGLGFAALAMGAFAVPLWTGRPDGAILHTGAVVLGGLLFGWCFGYHLLVCYRDYGGRWLITALGAIWACDTAAYAVGRRLGRHRLAPVVSPKKTWEGTVAGLVGAVAASALMARFLAGAPTWTGVGAGVVIGVTAQLSDLAESALKRDAAVKDSGNLVPGHGGLLDRTDSLLLSMPALVYLLRALGTTQ